MADRTLREILQLSPEQRKALFQVSGLPNKNIDKVIVDGNPFTDYSAFTFVMEKTLVESPTRSMDGSMELETHAWFLVPHLKIDFSLLSIEAYRTVMKLIRSKNEFVVTCYDIVEDKDVTHNMYFATEQMPKLWSIAKALNGGEPWVELLGVQDYTIELIGTNNDYEKHTITYNLNVPTSATWVGDTIATEETASNISANIGASIWNGTTDDKGNKQEQAISTITFGDTYRFAYWCENANGQGFRYVNGNEYLIQSDLTLYAIWTPSVT